MGALAPWARFLARFHGVPGPMFPGGFSAGFLGRFFAQQMGLQRRILLACERAPSCWGFWCGVAP